MGGMVPAVFVSHGAPTLPLETSATRVFLEGLGARLGRPRAVLCVSAHWEARQPHVSTAARPETIRFG
jgi:4,5-DOPA dioxygenase extradiol